MSGDAFQDFVEIYTVLDYLDAKGEKNNKVCSNCNVFSPAPSMTLIHLTDFVNRNFKQ